MTIKIITYIHLQVVYLARNPKDVIVSYYYHHKLMKIQDFRGDIEQFAQFFMDDECKSIIAYYQGTVCQFYNYRFVLLSSVFGSPYFPHVLDAWSKRHHPNTLFLFYEDMKMVKLNFSH